MIWGFCNFFQSIYILKSSLHALYLEEISFVTIVCRLYIHVFIYISPPFPSSKELLLYRVIRLVLWFIYICCLIFPFDTLIPSLSCQITLWLFLSSILDKAARPLDLLAEINAEVQLSPFDDMDTVLDTQKRKALCI